MFLLPVQIGDEVISDGRVRILCCTSKAELTTILIDGSTYDIVKSYIWEMENGNRKYAMVGVEVNPGNYLPVPVYIDSEHLTALENIAEHAVTRRVVPWVLRKYVKHIIALGNVGSRELPDNIIIGDHIDMSATSYEMLAAINKKDVRDGIVPEGAVPVYKARYSFPAVILKKVQESADSGLQRVLILDSDGDLAVSKVPARLLEAKERELDRASISENTQWCITYTQKGDGYIFSHLMLNRLQQQALETIVLRYEKTGSGERPLPPDACEILSRANNILG